ncbi:MAG: DUF4339 domain-containing protein [Chlamydiia bacterium]|nr:DUF4339 domain-containing protein [Chlamydiia bacterium]
MQLLLNLLFSVAFGAVCAYIAQQKNRNTTIWFILGLLFTFISLLILLFLPDLGPESAGEMEHVDDDEDVIPILTPRIVDAHWYYLDAERRQHGPVDMDALRALWQNNTVTQTTLVWSDGMAEWKQVSQLPELIQVLSD